MLLDNHPDFKLPLPYGAGSGEPSIDDIDSFFEEAYEWSHICEKVIVQAIEKALKERESNATTHKADKIFAAFTEYVNVARKFRFLQQPIQLWLDSIAPKVTSFEKEYSVHIHKGSPIYNVGLCYFESGDMDNGFRFIMAANDENRQAGLPGLLEQIEMGELPEQVFIDSIQTWVTTELGKDYKSITNRELTKEEFKYIIRWLASQREADAIQALISLHRLHHLSKSKPTNSVSSHLRVQALADLVLVIESNLKGWQSDRPAKETLCPRMKCMLKNYNDNALKQFETLTNSNSNEDIDKIIRESFKEFDTERDFHKNVGTVCHLVYKLRNSLLHVIGQASCINSDVSILYRVASCVLIVMHICQQSHANLASSIPEAA